MVFDQPWTKTREVRWEDVKCEQPEEQEEQAEVDKEEQFSKFGGQNEVRGIYRGYCSFNAIRLSSHKCWPPLLLKVVMS